MQNKIEEFYKNLNINIDIIKSIESYQLTTYYLKLDGFNPSIFRKILNSKELLQLYLQIDNINISTDNETGCIILQIPLKERKTLQYNGLVKDFKKQNNGLFVNVGINSKNEIKNINLCEFPHLLVAGTTGSGKSVFINSIILQLLENYTPQELQLTLVDIKKVEFSIYKNMPHLNYNILSNIDETKNALQEITENMMERYEIFKNTQCRNITEYAKKGYKMPYKLIIVDELAELLQQEKQQKLYNSINNIETIEQSICRIAQLGRAAGIHLIVATQRPSTDVVSGLIKSNIPSRVCLSVASAMNSRVILDEKGGENLTGKGDLLLKIVGSNKMERLQSAYISESDILQKLDYIKQKYNNYINITEKTIKRDIIKELENEIIKYFNYGEIKTVVYNNLQQKNVIDLIIKDIAQNETEKEILYKNYFDILKNTVKFYQGYINIEKEQRKQNIKNARLAATQKKQDKILNMYLWGNILKGINKML